MDPDQDYNIEIESLHRRIRGHVEQDLHERTEKIFRALAFFELDNVKKGEVAVEIERAVDVDPLYYWSQVGLSAAIATFGLLQNSVAVIIGAMLIAPLLHPIKGMAFGIASGRASQFWHSTLLLLKSVGASILMAYLATIILPIQIETSEIVARTSPNLLDLFISIASSVVAFLVFKFDELSESIGGVAMATSLMPPLAVAGIEIAFGHPVQAWGSFFLFVTNLFAIILVGTFMFFFYGFSPHQEESTKNTLKQLSVLLGLGLLITIPLASSLLRINESVQIEQSARDFISVQLKETLPQAVISDIQLLDITKDKIHLRGHMKLPEGSKLYEDAKQDLQVSLGEYLGRNVDLDLEVLRIASIVSRGDIVEQKDVTIRKYLRSLIQKNIPNSTIVQIDVTEFENSINTSDDKSKNQQTTWGIKTILALPGSVQFGPEQKEAIQNEMKTKFASAPMTFLWSVLQEQAVEKQSSKPTARDTHRNEIELKWESLFNQIGFEGLEIQNFQVSWDEPLIEDQKTPFNSKNIETYKVRFDMYLPESAKYSISSINNEVKDYANAIFDKKVDLVFRAFTYSNNKIKL